MPPPHGRLAVHTRMANHRKIRFVFDEIAYSIGRAGAGRATSPETPARPRRRVAGELELKNSMDLLDFPRLLTILVLILIMVTVIDQGSQWLRQRLN
jgi:hypothetical protein